MKPSKFPKQVERIERVKATLNFTDAQLAEALGVRPETMQKYAAGYQKAGERLLQLVEKLPAERQREPEPEEEPTSTIGRLKRILSVGSLEEVRIVRQLIDGLCDQIVLRDKGPARVYEGRHRFLPALGYIPAGMPQEAVQQANQFVAVPEDKFAEADYALKVQGDSMVDAGVHHGDWVVMTLKRDARSNNVVAALCDGETTLKTYVVEGRKRYLRAANASFPDAIVPKDELKVQGVMIGKL